MIAFWVMFGDARASPVHKYFRPDSRHPVLVIALARKQHVAEHEAWKALMKYGLYWPRFSQTFAVRFSTVFARSENGQRMRHVLLHGPFIYVSDLENPSSHATGPALEQGGE
jgi:hypothetical protein